MHKLFPIFLAFFLISQSTHAQFRKSEISSEVAVFRQLDIQPQRSGIRVAEGKLLLPDDRSKRWNRSLISYEKRHTLPENVRIEIEERTRQKVDNLKSYYPDESNLKDILNSPTIGKNFQGNLFDGYTPPDNSMAISNGGKIISVTNSHIECYDIMGSILFTSGFDDFFNDPELTSIIYDPVVLYDSGSDLFFMVVLHGTTSTTSKILVCFSKTNNPVDGWWLYKLPGNPYSNGLWFDYPKIGVSNNEVYITGNLFNDSGNFNQAILFQITKLKGYNGESISYQSWQNITQSPFTLVPASYGQTGNYGPGIYLVSTEQNESSDKIYFYDLTDDMTGNPQIKGYSINASFALAGNALQKGTDVKLDAGGTRTLAAFYLANTVHFVFQSEYQNNYYGINYNRLNVNNLSNWSSIFGLDGFDYCYPSLASFGATENDKSVMISFVRSGSAIYPEIRVVHCDQDGEWSGSKLVKAGEAYVDVLATQGVARWGDYCGAARKQNGSPPEMWLSGGYGIFRSDHHAFDTWISQVDGLTIGFDESPGQRSFPCKIYPNPVYDMVHLEFILSESMPVDITLMDVYGKKLKVLFKDIAPSGKNIFSFNKGALEKGIYFVCLKSDAKILKNEKIIVD